MINSKSSYWKSALIGSAMALIPHGAMAANKPLPCPTDSPLVDKAWVIQELTKQKVENRLRAIDSQKHHQVVVVTVDNIQEYGYGSIEQMANAIWTECKIWYRGENTGVVVLYTKTPSLYRIETASTERYLIDAKDGRITAHSKSNWVCEKTDVDCRLNDITDWIDQVIRKKFPDEQSVQRLRDSTKSFDKQKADRTMSEFLNNLWIWAVVVVVFWGSVSWWIGLVRRNRRKALKRQIFELSIKFKTEKSKYPEWFNSYMYETERNLEGLENSSDNDLDLIIKWWYDKIEFDETINSITDSIDWFEVKYQEIIQKVKDKEKEIKKKIEELWKLQINLKNEWFRFWVIQTPKIKEWLNPDKAILMLEEISSELNQNISKLKSIPDFYKSIEWLDKRVQEELNLKQTEYERVKKEYESIFGNFKWINLLDTVQFINNFVTTYQTEYKNKDIEALKSTANEENKLFELLERVISSLKDEINFYNKIPSQIALRQKEIWWLTVKQEYREEAKKYSQKTGNKKYDNYELWANIILLQELLKTISENYSQKKNLWEINNSFKEFDEKYNEAKSYIWLGATLAIIIGKEIAEAQRKIEEERQRKEAEKKRKKEAEERREEEEKRNKRRSQRNDDDDNTISIGGWGWGGGWGFEAGWGWGFGWGGVTDD
ncbi:MAG: hypothetical protein ACD_49C00002G0001 [uncultured bacterium (gcode 4)]|uniref:TPM domain-containing protein n=1 Tax=uncultured bacterium (gcode 4) TaxID=1234023 RepID=K2BXC5_9BACT|nr:MAG: hypothetical protein ACD_49C00002G0001 [uncultured bacterium (gcode 4)]